MPSRRHLRNVRHWVFDLDGTLTLAVHDFALIRRELGVPPTADILHWLGTLPPHEAAPLYHHLDKMEEELVLRTAAAPGAPELVRRLHASGASLGILTRNSRRIARLTLAHIGLDGYFAAEAVLGRDEAPPKPDPQGFLHLAALWGTGTETMAMVGDYLYDLQTGRAAGAVTVHVRGSRPHGWPDWADLEVETLAELAELLEESA
jgi:HAD superfamily hydrolase (TIGR01509 family)